MNILVANDDGINARGIHELVKALSTKADVYVCAPDSQRSASGHGITVAVPVVAEEVIFEGAKMAFQLSGTPADCVKLGMKLLAQRDIAIDMVYSGINHGGNYGTDTLYSGTVSAAIEGNICGVPAVAVSVNNHEATHFEYACELALDALDKSAGRIGPDTVLNINTPDLPKSEIKGLKCTTLGPRDYKEFFVPIETGDGRAKYTYTGEPVVYEDLPETMDVMAMQAGYATITPLRRDMTDYELMNELENWRIGE
jgi:5'-nucleotidase